MDDISNSYIKGIFHLKNTCIPIKSEDSDHLILTGKNGSGKTQTLKAISQYLDKIKEDTQLQFRDYKRFLK